VSEGIAVHRVGSRVVVLELKGEHYEFSATKIGRTIDAQFAEGHHIVVDLSGATFLDWATVSALLVAHVSASELQLGFAIVLAESTGWPVRRIFEVTGLKHILPVVPTLGEAIKRFRSAGSDRRTLPDRRIGVDRRQRWAERPLAERRNGGERRSGVDRRTAQEAQVPDRTGR
jgi:anti-anti-sigma factor